jgi:hypothetical protein
VGGSKSAFLSTEGKKKMFVSLQPLDVGTVNDFCQIAEKIRTERLARQANVAASKAALASCTSASAAAASDVAAETVTSATAATDRASSQRSSTAAAASTSAEVHSNV